MKTETVKHTQGPWSLFEPSPTETTQLIGNGTIHIADIYMTDFPAGMADARLIAAAPELLAALEGMIKACNNRMFDMEALYQANSAIRKARGE